MLLKSIWAFVMALNCQSQAMAVTQSEIEPDLKRIYYNVTGLETADAFSLEGFPKDQILKAKSKEEAMDTFYKYTMMTAPFYQNRLEHFLTRLSNEEANPYDDNGDDYNTSLVTAIYQNLDIRDIFTKSYRIVVRSSSNQGFLVPEGIISLEFDPNLKGRVSKGNFHDGIFSTQGFGKRFLKAGTNRKAIRAILDIFLCRKIESWKDASLPDHYVGSDIDPAPGGKPETYQSTCRGCHAPMDSMRGAFAYYDYKETPDSRTEELERYLEVVEKYNQNSNMNPDGNMTLDDSWENFLITPEHQAQFGWRGPVKGNGVKSFAELIVNSEAFQRCMTTKVIAEFCDQTEEDVIRTQMDSEFQNLAKLFREDSYRMKNHIQRISESKYCRYK